MEHHTQEKNIWILSGSIVVAAIIIGVAILYAGTIFRPLGNNVGENQDSAQVQDAAVKDILTLRQDDYVWGDRNAPAKLFLFSDTECPFCKQYHATLQSVMKTFGANGQLAVVYRHFPLDIHPRARREAEALECAGKLGGNDAFWKYTDRIFEITPSNNGLDPAQLPAIATYIGLDKDAFNKCLDEGTVSDRVEKAIQEGMQIGMNNYGTPYSVVVAKNGKTFPIRGAQPETAVRAIIQAALNSQ